MCLSAHLIKENNQGAVFLKAYTGVKPCREVNHTQANNYMSTLVSETMVNMEPLKISLVPSRSSTNISSFNISNKLIRCM